MAPRPLDTLVPACILGVRQMHSAVSTLFLVGTRYEVVELTRGASVDTLRPRVAM